MTTVVPGLRERKKLATRLAVREAALRLVARDGLDRVTVDQIAAAADIAPRTFRHYFSCKEEAVVAAARDGAVALVDRFRARPRAESVLRALGEAVVTVMAVEDGATADHLTVLRLIRTTPALLPWQLAVLVEAESSLAAAIADRVGDSATDRYPSVCAAAAVAAMRLGLDRWLDRPDGDAPSSDALRAEIDAALAELSRGLDRASA
ncbi:TetR/AcrR family transcriptional regulator [Actinomycetospora atypica]|uniref:TetR/AcrR family transcriptional regulator n=1 Tax=Actinomycetospora atypica TaxID=1290095 RepID=A0ABV9YVT7_9PSEU